MESGYTDGSEFDHRILHVLMENDHAYLLDPKGARARWDHKVEDAYEGVAKSAGAKYGRILEWLKERDSGSK